MRLAASLPSGWRGWRVRLSFPLCISLSGYEFPRFAAAMSGELVAFYQAGYGVAAFGVGPLRDLTGGPLGIIYVFGSLVAAAMVVVALAVVVPVPKGRASEIFLKLRANPLHHLRQGLQST